MSWTTLSLTHELTNEEDISCSTITDNIILSSCCTTDHSSSWVLDLHLMEENSSVLGQFYLACATDEPKTRLINIQEHSRAITLQ